MFKIALDLFCGIAGLLAALYLAKLFTDPEAKPWPYRVLVLLFLVLVYEALKLTMGPPVLAWKGRQDIEKLLATDKLLSTVVADFPTLRTSIRDNYVKAYQLVSQDQAVAVAKATAGTVLPKYLSRAPDANVARFSNAMVSSLRAMLKHDPDRCYRYLYPAVAGPVSPAKDEGGEEIAAALQEAMLGAHDRPAQVDRQDAPRLLQAIGARLAQQYGGELAMLGKPTDPSVNRAKVCEMTISLYTTALSLEPSDSAKVFRLIYAQ
jgi:hypothetical protein